MGRTAGGWKLRRKTPGGVWYCRFVVGKRRYEISTGTTEYEKARSVAADLYARTVATAPSDRPRHSPPSTTRAFSEAGEQWLSSLTGLLDPATIDIYRVYLTSHFEEWFQGLERFNQHWCDKYMQHRLAKVQARTVQKELSALRRFAEWCEEQGLARPVVPFVPKRATGVTYGKRRRVAAIELTPEECEAIAAALPEKSGRRGWDEEKLYPVRARFLIAYDTGLRPGALDELSVPENYRRGNKSIRLRNANDKARWGREVVLTPRAREALDAVIPTAGLIFGKHDYRARIYAAAKTVLGKVRAELFCAAHFRSATATHLLDRGVSLTATQWQLGHKHVSTTAKYVRPTLRVARQELEAVNWGAPQNSRRARKRVPTKT